MGEIRHAIERTGSVIGVLGTLALIALGIWMAWTTFIQPHTKWRIASTSQKAEHISNQYITLQEDNCWIKFLGVKAICFKNEKVYQLIKEGDAK